MNKLITKTRVLAWGVFALAAVAGVHGAVAGQGQWHSNHRGGVIIGDDHGHYQNYHEFLDALRQRLRELKHHARLKRRGWRLVWHDEFRGEEIDSSHWSHEVNCWGGGNNEQQCYTDRPENAFVDNGLLHIVAREETFSGPAVNDDDPAYDPEDTSVTKPFTSARLRTKGKVDFTYGRVEIRARPAAGQGMWSALWMLPTDFVYGGWPLSGEIDIMEAVNPGVGPDENLGTLHYGLAWPQWEVHGQTLPLAAPQSDDFHVYAIEWEDDEIRWYFDGEHYQTQNSEGWYTYTWQGQDTGFAVPNPRAPFDEDFHLLMNVAVGGDLPGAPDTGWSSDREMLVDWVRVYRCKKDRSHRWHHGWYGGKHKDKRRCATVDESVAVNEGDGAPQVNDFLLYADGPETLTFEVDGATVSNTPVPGQWESAPGNVVQAAVDVGGEHGTVWDIQFNGLGNVFLTSGDMSSVPGVDTGLDLWGGSGWINHGELEFDMYVHSIDPETQLLAKIDSGYPNVGQVAIETPPEGEWTHVAVSISDLLANPIAGGAGIDPGNVLNAFVLEPTGTHLAHVQIDNVRLQCSVNPTPESWQQDQTCGIGPRLSASAVRPGAVDIYIDGINGAVWDMGYQEFSTAGDHITQSEVDRGGGNTALDLRYEADGQNGVGWIQSSEPVDLSSYADGKLVLDVNVLDWGTNTGGLMIKVECSGGVCSSGDYFIGDAADLGTGVWNSLEIDIADLLDNPGGNLDLSAVDVALVIFPAWGDQQGVHFQVDNARFVDNELTVYEDNVTFWDIGVCCGGVEVTEMPDDVDPSHGNVVQFSYSTDTTVTYFQSERALDLTDWAGGTVEFDLLVLSEPPGATWMMKTDCRHPCSTGDVPLTASVEGVAPTVGSWQHYTFEIDDLVARGLQLDQVDTPLVIFPAWGNQNGAVFRVDNIRVVKAPSG